MAATASRSSSGLPPLAIIANGSKPPVSVRHRLQVEFEHTPVGHTVVPGGVDPPGQRTKVVGAGDAGQEVRTSCEPTDAPAVHSLAGYLRGVWMKMSTRGDAAVTVEREDKHLRGAIGLALEFAPFR